jgi:PAS domain S-box-containing protein
MQLNSETVAQRRALRELAALSTIPAAWLRKEPTAIAVGLADVLVGSLCLDFAFVRMCDPKGGAPIEVTRGQVWETFPAWLRRHLDDAGRLSQKEIVIDLGGAEPRRGVVIPVGVNSESGLVAAASTRIDFPSEIDQLLLSVVVNQAAAAFQNALLRENLDLNITELRKLQNELEIKVAERTAKLTIANEELYRQKEQLDRLFELSPNAVILADQNFQTLRVNQEFTRMFGYSPEDAVGRPLIELVVPEEFRADTRKNMALVLSGERLNLESVRQRKDGVRLDVSIAIAPLSLGCGQRAIYLIYRDVTGHKKAERELRRSERYLAEAQRLSHTGSFGWSIPSGQIFWSEETFQIFQYDPTTKPTVELVLQRVYPEDVALVKHTIERASQDGTDFEHEYRLLMPDSSIKYVHAVAYASREK